MPETALTDEALKHLEALATDLNGRGLTTRVAPGGRYPSLSVVNETASHLSEQVYVARAAEGSVWYWWSWSERICQVTDRATAAAKIVRVLRATA